MTKRWSRRIVAPFRKHQAAQELDEELKFHLAKQIEFNLARGMSAEEARRSALIEFGGFENTREEVRAVASTVVLETLLKDFAYAGRILRRSPGFSAVAILVLALGIAAPTAIFSIVNATLIRPLPYKDPSRLVALASMYRSRTGQTVSLDEVEELRRSVKSFESIGSFVFSAGPATAGNETSYVVSAGVDPELLRTLGTGLAMGHGFSGSGSTVKDHSTIISHRFWLEAFDGDRNVVGRSLMVDGQSYTVIGVLDATFQFPRADESYAEEAPDVLFPIANIADIWGRASPQWFAVARLAPGVMVEQAESEVRAVSEVLRAKEANKHPLYITISSMAAATTHRVRPALLLILGISLVLLLIACTNTMGLYLSRAPARGREMSIRMAVGAPRFRLVRQLLAEAVVLTFLAGALGVLLARFALTGLLLLLPMHLPVSGTVDVDRRVLAFAFATCALAAVISGLLPAVRQSAIVENPFGGMNNRSIGGRRNLRFRGALTVVQTALGVGLLVAASLLAHSLMKLSSVDPGFRTAGVIGFELASPSTRGEERARHLDETILDAIRSIPGIDSAGWITNLPPETRAGVFMPFSILGVPAESSAAQPAYANYQIASEDLFRTLGVPMLQGRDFRLIDTTTAPHVVIVNQALARQYFGSKNPMGQSIVIPWDGMREIMGIIPDIHDRGLQVAAIPTIYLPLHQFALPYGSVAVRTRLPLTALVPEVRKRIAAVDSSVAVKNFQTLTQRMSKTLDGARFYAVMSVACALMATLFVALGLYGVVTYSVSERTPEIGVRMALGARHTSILGMVLRQSIWLTGLGLVIGLTISIATGRFMRSLLFQVKPNDPLTLLFATALVIIVMLLASYLPARRAISVDPMYTLRHE